MCHGELESTAQGSFRCGAKPQMKVVTSKDKEVIGLIKRCLQEVVNYFELLKTGEGNVL